MNKISKTALVCGISGQDGAYLANLLLKKEYIVWGTSRDAQGRSFSNLSMLGIKEQVRYLSMPPEDFRSVLVALQHSNPDEVYFLAGQSSVGLSFEFPAETIQSMVIGLLNVLEAVRRFNPDIKIFYAGSSECFGDTSGVAATENMHFYPKSPYAVAKSSAFWLVNNYREAYGLYCCTGILFNHESPLRPARFVTQKIIQSVQKIANGSTEKLVLGRLDIQRDWGWAAEYVEAMWLMLQQDGADDYIIATGKSYELAYFVQLSFEQYNLNWQDYVVQNPEFMRPTDLNVSLADPTKALKQLGWSAKVTLQEIVYKMIHKEYY